MKKYLLPGLMSALLALPAHAVTHQCPDYESPQTAPSLAKPAKNSFRNFGNTWLSWMHRPFHMVHDEFVKEGQAVTVVGKFDYSSVLHKDLEFEDVHVYLYGTGMSNWQYMGEYRTDSDGKVHVSVPPKPEGDYKLRMIVEGDHSEAEGYLTVMKPGRKAVLFDIDGTLTTNDFEAVGDYLGIEKADAYNYADELVWNYVNKGYQIVYLTGRQYWMSKMTRSWLNYQGLFNWHLKMDSNAENPVDPQTQAYKTAYIRKLKNDLGLNIIRAYGNAETDVWAYADAGIPKSETYIIGPNAGMEGTHAIQDDYTLHYSTVAVQTPEAGCVWR